MKKEKELDILLEEIEELQGQIKKYSAKIDEGLFSGNLDWDSTFKSIELMDTFNEKVNKAIKLM